MPYADPAKAKAFWEERRRKNLSVVRAYKVDQGCKDCGYNKHFNGLEFDHPDPQKKSGTIPRLVQNSKNGAWEELLDCDVVCATCHKVRTYERKVCDKVLQPDC